MRLQDQLTLALLDTYVFAGKEVGYWARRFLQALKRDGGLATARRMLGPRNEQQRKGLDALLEAEWPDLTVEAVVLRPEFESLFSQAELNIARERLGQYGRQIAERQASRELYPDELDPKGEFVEGAKKQILVNAHERDIDARKACLKTYGYDCVVCSFNFQARYGLHGKDFIHVHHLKPLALSDGAYAIDPVRDLRPVCPNCHAMLHRGKEVLSIEELRQMLAEAEA